MKQLRLFACLLLAALPLAAHHSFGAEYDANKPVTLTGVVTNVEWTNPDSYIFMDVKNTSGAVEKATLPASCTAPAGNATSA